MFRTHKTLLIFSLLALACLHAVTTCVALAARYARPDLERIPVDQLLNNLKQLVEKDAENIDLRNNLARAHAMAFAKADAAFEIRRGQLQNGLWFGFEPPNLPFARANAADDDARREDAAEHLKTAITLYEEILKADKSHLVARLGYAWCLEQDDQEDKAVEQYRLVAAEAWEKEKGMTLAGLGFHAVTSEAAGYLIPLLDETADAREITELQTRSKQVDSIRRPITPIAIPLRANLTLDEMLAREAAVAFDVDGSGRHDARWSWITPDAAWLVYDKQHTGRVDSGLQLFGNVTFWMFWDNGYQPLAALDDNSDGQLTGQELAPLALWRDANSNGISEPVEVKSLSEHGVTSLNCLPHPLTAAQSAKDCAAWSAVGVTFANGESRPTYDVILHELVTKSPIDVSAR